MNEDKKLRRQVAKVPHEHMLLWNLRACRSNALYSPWEDQKAKAAKLVPIYEEELKARGHEVPAIVTDEVLSECIARMVEKGEAKKAN